MTDHELPERGFFLGRIGRLSARCLKHSRSRSRPERPIRVLFLSWLLDNAYCSLMAAGVRLAGARVSAAERMPIARLLRALRTGCILHLQWVDLMIARGSTLKICAAGGGLIAAVVLLRLFRIKIVWVVHNLLLHESEHPRAERIFGAVLCRAVNARIVHSASAASTAGSFFFSSPRNFTVIRHPNYIGYYPSSINEQEARRDLGIDSEAAVFLVFGKIRKYKGLELLLEALPLVHGNNFRFIIAGSPENSSLIKQIAEMAARDPRLLCFPQFVPDGRLQFFFKSCDAVVLPYTSILTSGLSVLASSFAKPCIVPSLPLFCEELPPDSNLFYDGTVHGLAAALRKAHELRARLKEMGEANLRAVTDNSYRAAGADLMRLYRSL